MKCLVRTSTHGPGVRSSDGTATPAAGLDGAGRAAMRATSDSRGGTRSPTMYGSANCRGGGAQALAQAITRLPDRERLVVTLYYYEELTLREIGEVLSVTESRVSQLHTKAILRLRVRLQGSLDHAA